MPDTTHLIHLVTRLHDDLVRRGRHVLGFGGACQTCQAHAMRLRRKRAA